MKISKELHKRFKIACVVDGTDMSTVIRRLIEQYVEKIEKRMKQ